MLYFVANLALTVKYFSPSYYLLYCTVQVRAADFEFGRLSSLLSKTTTSNDRVEHARALKYHFDWLKNVIPQLLLNVQLPFESSAPPCTPEYIIICVLKTSTHHHTTSCNTVHLILSWCTTLRRPYWTCNHSYRGINWEWGRSAAAI